MFIQSIDSLRNEHTPQVKTKIEVALGTSAPAAALDTLRQVPGLAVRRAATPYVRHGEHRWLIRLLPRPLDDGTDPAALVARLQREWHADQPGVLPMIVAASLPRPLRSALAEVGLSYVDGQGDVHLVAPGLLVHVDRQPLQRAAPPQQGPIGLGSVGIRTVQALLTLPDRPWTIAELAESAAVSVGQAHRVAALLDAADLLETQGAGPRKRRRVRDRAALLDWLARQPTARRVYAQRTCSLYARGPRELASRATDRLETAGIAHAFSGALAATLHGAGPTAVPRAILRIDPEVPLDAALGVLGAEVTERGANLVLRTDTGRVGVHGREHHQGAWLAPKVRIYLDLLGERRGEDMAAQFRELVLKV